MSGFDSLWQRSTSGRKGTAEAGTRTGRLRGRRRLLVALVAMVVAGVVVTVALAAEYDLSTSGAPDVTIHNAIYQQFNPVDPTGSGTFESFVRLSTNNLVERGYNTSHRKVQFDENTSPTFTHDEPLSHVPTVVHNGVL